MSTAYELAHDGRAMATEIAGRGGEVTDEEAAAFDAWLHAVETKHEDLHRVALRLQAEADACGEEVARLLARKRARMAEVARIRERARELLVAHRELTGEARLRLPTLTVYLQATTAVVGPVDPSEWPEAYQRRQVIVSPDREAAREALRRGEAIPGVTLETTESVRWR